MNTKKYLVLIKHNFQGVNEQESQQRFSIIPKAPS